MKLRDYQSSLIQQVQTAYREGYKRPCIVLPCGGGKSVIAAEIAKKTTHCGNRVLFIVHRYELCDQITRTFRSWGVDMQLCNIGMVQTVTRRLHGTPKPTLIITDESHHSLAKSYRNIYNYFPDAYGLGITATPKRLDGSGLGDINDKLIIGPTVEELIRRGNLADFDYYSPVLVDTSELKTERGEYNADAAEKLLDSKAIHGDVIKHYSQLCAGKQAICYCPSLKYSRKMAEKFNDAGIIAEHIDGSTPAHQRDSIIQQFRNGAIQVLCNMDLISEGLDIPDCGAVILLRPTQSLCLHIQQSMRCMRYKEGKRAVIIDHVGNVFRHGTPLEIRDWKLNYPKKKKFSGDNECIPDVLVCPECYHTHSIAPCCPSCGYVYKKKARQIYENPDGELQKLTAGFTLNYSNKTPADCKTYDELLEYAKSKGYRKGWAYHKSRELRLI